MLASQIANAYAEAYVGWQLEAKNELARKASEWLAADLDQIRAQMQSSDLAVERYKQAHDLLSISNKAERSETLVSQTLRELNSQLTVATSDLAVKQAILKGVQQRIRENASIEASIPVMTSSNWQSTREVY